MADTLSMIKTIYFFKVPFDNTYKNVLSFPGFNDTSSTTIVAQLIILYDSFSYTIPNNKRISIKETNGKSVISISGSLTKPYKEIKDYNYCAIAYDLGNNKTSYSFYFVTSYDSLNQGTIPSTLIQIEYDCWLNNYSSISKDTQNFTLVRGHRNDVFTVSNAVFSKYRAVNATINSYEITYMGAQPRILWVKLKLRTLKNYYIEPSEGVYVTGAFASANSVSSQVPIVYAPVAVFDPNTRSLASQNTFSFRTASSETTYPIGKMLFALTTQNVIDSAEFTYYPPFPITYNSTAKLFVVGNDTYNMQLKDLLIKDENENVYEHLFVAVGSFGGVICYNFGQLKPVYDNHITQTLIFDAVPKSSYDGKIFSTVYPFIKYSLYVGSEKIPIIPPENAYRMIIDVHILEDIVEYCVYFQDKTQGVISSMTYTPSFSNGLITTIGDQSSLFYRNNGNQFLAQQNAVSTRYQMQLASNAVGLIANPSAGGVVSFAKNVISSSTDAYLQNKMFEAKKNDINNYLTTVSQVSNDALKSALNQDLVYVIKETYQHDDSANAQLFELYKYGIQLSTVDNINNLPYKYFNFKQFVEYSAPYITNNMERETVENILTNGVFIWCDRFLATSEDLNIIKNMQIVDGNKLTEVT